MHFLSVSILCAFFSSAVIAESAQEKVVGISEVPGDITSDESPEEDLPKPTIFNRVEVPPILEIQGEKFNSTVKDGYWLVKHYS